MGVDIGIDIVMDVCMYAGQFAEYCQPDILHYNQTVLPVLFQTLEDPRPTLQGTSCYVLEYFWFVRLFIS